MTANVLLRIIIPFVFAFSFLKPDQVSGQTPIVLSDSIAKKVDALFKKWDTPNSPGCVIGISGFEVNDGRIMHLRFDKID
ncbi:hypothetical protein [Pedobacter ginsengisoli]|uniref:hypothetical protein n=1 Tax=Pedobacter ginsengisoli TaxID=363852 RepID=UPI00254CE8D8|nr:hypothetical protein [Pedobacter ginsengisoli]